MPRHFRTRLCHAVLCRWHPHFELGVCGRHNKLKAADLTSANESKPKHAKFGAAAYADLSGELPKPFPRTMGPNAIAYLQEVVDSGLTVDMLGRFEKTFADKLGIAHVIGTPGCTPALAVLAMAINLKPGDEVIVSPICDYGTVAGLCQAGAIPVFADTDAGSPNMSAATIEPLVTDRTRAVLCVHKTGIMCDMDPILALAKQHDLLVFEDCCQAIFSQYKGRLAGTLGDAAGFSFDSEKTMGSDVGGCLVTKHDHIAERARFMGHARGAEMRDGFGRIHTEAGVAHRMPACTAAVTLAQLEIVDANVAQRDKMARLISNLLDDIPGITALRVPDDQNVWSCWMHGFSLDAGAFTVGNDAFAAACNNAGLPAGTGRYYNMAEALTFLQDKAAAGEYPFSQPPASRTYTYDEDSCPNAHAFLDSFVRWISFCEKYEPQHCEQVAAIVQSVADAHRL